MKFVFEILLFLMSVSLVYGSFKTTPGEVVTDSENSVSSVPENSKHNESSSKNKSTPVIEAGNIQSNDTNHGLTRQITQVSLKQSQDASKTIIGDAGGVNADNALVCLYLASAYFRAVYHWLDSKLKPKGSIPSPSDLTGNRRVSQFNMQEEAQTEAVQEMYRWQNSTVAPTDKVLIGTSILHFSTKNIPLDDGKEFDLSLISHRVNNYGAFPRNLKPSRQITGIGIACAVLAEMLTSTGFRPIPVQDFGKYKYNNGRKLLGVVIVIQTELVQGIIDTSPHESSAQDFETGD